MEHISRLTTRNVDTLLLVSDTSRRSLQAAFRIQKLAQELNIGFNRSCLIVNQSKNGLSETTRELIKQEGLELAGIIPDDPGIYDFDSDGRATIELPEGNLAVQAAFKIFDTIVK